jgi:acyl-coenzyme A synthetase/AMP-(fatty) acid ligase
MLYGACLYIYNLRKSGIVNLGPWLNSHRITVFHAVTSIYRQFVGQLGENDRFPHIRCVTPGGEPSRMSDIEQFKQRFEHGTVYYANLGSSECGSIAFDPVYHETSVHPDLPVGIPFESLMVFILDQDANPLPIGEIGEIALCSNSIFKEYWRDPEKTAAALKPFDQERKLFLTGDYGYVLPDGRLVNKGREDGQVKVNGYRVEIPEVESALLTIRGVRETAVVTRPDESENLRLVAFIRMDQPDDEFPVAEIRGQLLELLPRPMVPTQYYPVSRFPLKDNGKLNRQRMSSAPLETLDFLIQ